MKDSQLLKKKQRKFKKRNTTNVSHAKPITTVSLKDKVSGVLANSKKSLPKKVPQVRIPKLYKPHFTIGNFGVNIKKLFKKYESDIQLILLPLLLFFIVIILDVINVQMLRVNSEHELSYATIESRLHPYPMIHQTAQPYVTAESAIILDRDSQVILYQKNADIRFSMASTTKIMTALTGLDYYKLDDVLTIQRNNVEGSGLHLVRGEKYTFQSLLYAMLLPSANDAAMAIADNYPEGAGGFVDRMNKKAQSLHLSNTHFADAAGLDDDQDYTTVVDLARLASYAMSNPTFVDITSTKTKTIRSISGSRQLPLTNLNKLLGISGVTGIKTGTTEGAGEVLVTSLVKGNHTFVIVVMRSTDRFTDTSSLINYIDNNVEFIVPSVPVLK